MKIQLLDLQDSSLLEVHNLKSDELAVALQCKFITFDKNTYSIHRSDMIVPKYSPITDSTPYVDIYVSLLR